MIDLEDLTKRKLSMIKITHPNAIWEWFEYITIDEEDRVKSHGDNPFLIDCEKYNSVIILIVYQPGAFTRRESEYLIIQKDEISPYLLVDDSNSNRHLSFVHCYYDGGRQFCVNNGEGERKWFLFKNDATTAWKDAKAYYLSLFENK